MDTDDLVTVRQAADMLGVGTQTIRNALNHGRLASVRVLGRIAIARADVEAYRARTRPIGIKPRGRPKKTINTTGTGALREGSDPDRSRQSPKHPEGEQGSG